MLIYFEYANPIVSKKVGKVAIRCPLCERPRVHTVIERFKAQTFFFWQLGARGPAIETVAKCKNCRHESFFSRGDFEDIVPLDEEIYLDELVHVTAPWLQKYLDVKDNDDFEQSLSNSNPSSSTGFRNLYNQPPVTAIQQNDDVRVPQQEDRQPTNSAAKQTSNDFHARELMEAIEPFWEIGGAYDRLHAKLQMFDELNASEKAKVAKRVQTFVKRRLIEEMLFEATTNFPAHNLLISSVLIAIPVFLLTALVLYLIFTTTKIADQEEGFKDIIIGTFYMFAVPLALAAVSGFVSKRWWYYRTLRPTAARHQIDLSDAFAWLEEMTDFKSNETPNITAMRKEVGVYRTIAGNRS